MSNPKHSGMSAAKHTPVAEVAEDFVFLLRKQDDGSRWPVGTKLYAESQLIAAAPDLIAGAQTLLDAFPAHATHRNHKEREAYARLRAAIAKATGSAS